MAQTSYSEWYLRFLAAFSGGATLEAAPPPAANGEPSARESGERSYGSEAEPPAPRYWSAGGDEA